MSEPQDQSFSKEYWRDPRSFKYQANPQWAAVDEFNWKHLHAGGSIPDPAIMDQVLKGSVEAGLPPIAVNPAHGKFLQLQARMIQAKTVVEVGMLGGYSTIWLATANDDIKVTSIEIDDEFAAVASKHFELAGVSSKIEIKVANAMDELPKLVQQVQDGTRPKIDMAFIDANKTNGLEYFEYCLAMARPGAVIVVDNVVRMGGVVDESKFEDPNIKGTRRLIEGVGRNKWVDASILQTVGDKSYDGFLTAVVRSSPRS